MNQNKILIPAIMLILIVASFHLASAVSITSVESSPSEVAPGGRFTLDLTIKNDLNDDIENVDISLDLNNLQFSPVESSQRFTDEISEGKSRSFEFELQANSDIAGGSYKIPVMIKYKIPGNTTQQQINSLISVLVNSKPKFNLDSDSVLIQNQKTNLDIKITNIGLTGAKFLEVELGSGSYNLLSSSRVYIGNLNSDDFDTASYSINVKSSGMINFPVTLTYRDSANKEYTEAQTVMIKSYSQQEAINLGLIQKSNTGLYIGIAIFAIIVFIVYRIIRGILRRRKKKQEV